MLEQTNNRIKALEELARPLEPGADERLGLAQAAIEYAEEFLEGLADAPAFQMGEAGASELYRRPIDADGIPLDEALDLLRRNVDNQGINTPSAGHLAYIPGGNLYHAALADFLGDIGNRFSGHFFGGPGAVRTVNSKK